MLAGHFEFGELSYLPDSHATERLMEPHLFAASSGNDIVCWSNHLIFIHHALHSSGTIFAPLDNTILAHISA